MSNCLITRTGKRIDCLIGETHEITAKRELPYDVDFFLTDRGGIRIKVCWPDTETIAIEYYYKLTDSQIRTIRKILRQSNYYAIILESKLITKFRPIRSFDFNSSLVPKQNINGLKRKL